jgi:macrophage erythroblast attacher
MADHQNSTIKHGDHLLLDQPLLRLPNELLRNNFRSAHFNIEKDASALKNLLKDSATAAVSGRASQDEVLKNLDAMAARMRGVRRKLASHADEEARLHDHLLARVKHLDELYSVRSVDDVKYEAWSRRRLDRLLADYLLRHGYTESAGALAADRGMEKLVDVETFAGMSRIREALKAGSPNEALAWCAENKKELRKMESKLEFMLRFQQYIELVRSRSPPETIINHGRKHLIPYRTTYTKEVWQACGLLACPPDGGAYPELFKPSRWQELADLFTTTHNKLLALPSVPLLHTALTCGLSALKTPACHSSSLMPQNDGVLPSAPIKAAPTLNHGVCPICSTELNDLARNVPYANQSKSHLEADLMLLPNGRAYGRQRLEEQAKKAGLPPGIVKDQITDETFSWDSLKKVYIS